MIGGDHERAFDDSCQKWRCFLSAGRSRRKQKTVLRLQATTSNATLLRLQPRRRAATTRTCQLPSPPLPPPPLPPLPTQSSLINVVISERRRLLSSSSMQASNGDGDGGSGGGSGDGGCALIRRHRRRVRYAGHFFGFRSSTLRRQQSCVTRLCSKFHS